MLAIEDQVTAVQEAARLYPQLDLGWVGIRGWSFGGSLAAMAVLRRPDIFHVAAAGAGVTDSVTWACIPTPRRRPVMAGN